MFVLCSLALEGSDRNVFVTTTDSTVSQEADTPQWLEAIDYSSDQLDADYERTIAGENAGEFEILIADILRRSAEGEEVVIPVFFEVAPVPEEDGERSVHIGSRPRGRTPPAGELAGGCALGGG